LANISPEEHITPAGRFVAALGVNLAGRNILWVEYHAALSLHRVVAGNASEHRQQRLATATALDNRISYGCINVPTEFCESVVRPLFSATIAIVYILPETQSIEDMFFMPPSQALSPAVLGASSPWANCVAPVVVFQWARVNIVRLNWSLEPRWCREGLALRTPHSVSL
jgi:hypothetical protein